METLEQLHELHDRLVRAQRAETAAIEKLSEYVANGKRPRDGFDALLDAAQAARQRTVEIYAEWDRHVRALQNPPPASDGTAPLEPEP